MGHVIPIRSFTKLFPRRGTIALSHCGIEEYEGYHPPLFFRSALA
jgi:hypothetical protein